MVSVTDIWTQFGLEVMGIPKLILSSRLSVMKTQPVKPTSLTLQLHSTMNSPFLCISSEL